MERSGKNKENIPRSVCITSMFKVKKCLFDQTVTSLDKESNSPKAGQQQVFVDSPMVVSPNVEDSPYNMFKVKKKMSPMVVSPNVEDSPYNLFKVKKKKSITRTKVTATSTTTCSNYSASGSIVTTPTNKKYADKEVEMGEVLSCYQRSPNSVKLAVQKSMLDPNLTGDFSKPCTLQTIQGRHPDLLTVSPSLVASLLQGTATFSYTLIDCRYPYEFDAGHIKDALNVYMKEDIVKLLLDKSVTAQKIESNKVLIFYCEFSSERGPSMLRHLRNTDREMNNDFYPFLFYPELYVMEGGYKAFFSDFKELCDPQEYKRMLDRDCADQLAFYKSKCKSMSRSSKRLKRTRSSLAL